MFHVAFIYIHYKIKMDFDEFCLTYESHYRRVLLGGIAASTARAIIETPLELAKVISIFITIWLNFCLQVIMYVFDESFDFWRINILDFRESAEDTTTRDEVLHACGITAFLWILTPSARSNQCKYDINWLARYHYRNCPNVCTLYLS